MKNKLRNILLENKDDNYREFHSKLCSTKYTILGINLPTLRKIAKDLSKEDLNLFFDNCYDDYYEEIMVQGLSIGYSKYSREEALELIKKFINKIDNWAICDSFCNTIKIVEKNKEFFLPFLLECLKSNEEFIIRFGIITLMNYYIEEKYIEIIIKEIKKINIDYYYVQMGQAWFFAESYLYFPDKITNILKNKELSKFVHNKSIQKMIESYRVNKKQKTYLKTLKQ